MLDSPLLNSISQQFTKMVEQPMKPGLNPPLRAVIEASLSKLNLVTRSEFDAQSAVLARSRAKVDALEAQLAELEKQLTAIEQQSKGSSE